MSDQYDADDDIEAPAPEDESLIDWDDPDELYPDPAVSTLSGVLDGGVIQDALDRANTTDDLMRTVINNAGVLKQVFGDKDEMVYRLAEDIESVLETLRLEAQRNPGRLIIRALKSLLIVDDATVLRTVHARYPNPDPNVVTKEYLAVIRSQLITERTQEVVRLLTQTQTILAAFEAQIVPTLGGQREH